VPVKGENIETQIDVTIEEAFYGANKKISLRAVDGKMKNFTIKVPSGIRNGEKIRLLGQGKLGANGGKNGDLLIKINISNTKKYKLHGFDIYTDLFLTPWEAALGTKANVETIDDSTSIFVPNGIESGEKIRIPKKGYKDGKGGRGDLVAEVKIMVPKELSEEETNIYKKLKEISNFEPRNNINQM
jgi:curved DNA-binding protein